MPPLPTIEGESVVLRPFRSGEAEAVAGMAADPAIAEHLMTEPRPVTPEGARAWIELHGERFDAGERLELAVTTRGDGPPVGCIKLLINRPFEHAELGYWIGRPHWGRGLATAAARALVAWAFPNLGLHRIQAHCRVSNHGSRRVLEKTGMTREGRFRDYVKFEGGFEDVVYYAVLAGEHD